MYKIKKCPHLSQCLDVIWYPDTAYSRYKSFIKNNRRGTVMSGVKIFDNKPVAIELEANKEYFWCACGRSSKQPFCDGSHRGTQFTPMKFSVKQSEKKYICLCKHSKNPPFCDGSHKSLELTKSK